MNEVIPWVGVENVRFGESREVVRERLGDFSSFKRSPGDSPVDHYSSIGLMLHFDRSDLLDFIEATGASELSFSGIPLLWRPFGEIQDDLRSHSVDFSLDDSGCVLTGCGIELYTPAPDELDIRVEGVTLRAPERKRDDSGTPEPSVGPAVDEDTLF
ncbi:hypothetical protein AB0O05_34725 [Streptomyces sp. NPDC093084]|uniref:hypothetical protein n=1 Tax=Streptomyces sp. NPDC093084 TaxID=3155197 RepID=UPI00343519F7